MNKPVHRIPPAGALSVLLTMLFVTGCATVTGLSTSSDLEPQAFAAAMAEPGTITLNVHIPDEGSIDGTDLYLAYDRIAVDRSHLPPDTATPLAVYCKTGRMSDVAADELRRLGYQDVVELKGGMDEWARRGMPLRAP